MVNSKTKTDVSIFSTGTTGSSVAPDKRVPGKKMDIKSLATSPPRKDQIPNQYKTP